MYFKVLSQSLVLLLGFFNPFVAIIAQNPKLEQISAADGLSQGMIYDLLQDNKGYIWFSTRDGLNRYDGYYCRVYQNNPFDPFSLSDNEAQVIREDKLGRIWVGTVNNGLSVFDPTTGKFHHIRNLPSQNVNAIFEGPDGEMWIGTNNGLCKIRVPDSLAPHKADLIDVCQVETITLEQVKDQQKTTVTSIRDLLVAPDGKIWVATKNQFGYYNPQNKSYTAKFDFDGIHNGKNGSAYFRLGPDQSIWVCLPGRLMRYKGDLVSIYLLPMSSIFPRTDCVFDPHGNLFVSTRKQIFKLPANCVDRADHPGFELFYEFPSIGIAGSTKMMFDQGGLLWIGTNGYGALKHNPGNPFFKHYAKGRSPRRIFTDNQDHVWAFLEGGLFWEINTETEQVGQKLLANADLTEHDAVLENGGAIWLVAEKRSKPGSGVLLKLFPGNLQPEYMVDVPIPIGIYSRIQKSTQGRFWISGSNSTFALFDPVSKSFQSFDHSSVTGFKEASFTLHEDEHGAVWIGTPHGLVKFNRDEGKIRYELYKNNPQNLQSLNCNFILSFLDDPYQPDKFCWIGTKGGGLNLLNKHSGEVKHFTQKEGLPNNVVYGILLDADSCLWLSTNRGLSKFNSKANVFSTFYNVDGLQDNEFNTLSYAKDQSGRMYFGGVNGITAFYPKEIQATTIAPKVEITDFWVNGKILNTGSFSKNAMNLEYEQNQVTFKFAAMDFAAPQHNRYKHRLLGVDAQWTFPSTSNSAAYVHLSPGTYVFEVMTGGSKGIWNGEPARFEFTILPPWWQTWPAYALYFLAIVSLIWAIIHFQVNKIRLENKLKFEQKEAERLAGLDKIKTDFFSGVTHEFRTPITLILEPIRQLKKRLEKEEDIETAEMIERNSERLLTYVNQLLDLSKLEAGQMPLDLRFCDPVELTNLAIKQFGSAFADRDIHLNLNMPEASSLIYLDESKWAQILNNLVSNAIKFSHNGGQITVSLSLTPLQFNTTQLLQLIVSDEGIGIQPEDLPRVFDRFFQAKHGKGGSGIGLALTQELVEKMEGSISVESEVGKGASFKVVVPCSVWNGSVDQPAPMHAGVNPAAMIEKVHVDALQTNHPTVGQPGTEPYLILLVEDEPEIRRFTASTLPSDFRVAEAGDGEAGLKLAMELVPDIIISDVAMPVKDGFEMTRSLKQNNITSHIPVILLTAKTSHESKMVGLESGADAYLSKPFRTEELIQVVRNLLNARLKWQSFYAQHPVHTSAGQPPIDSPAEEHNFIKQLKAVIDLNLDKESMDADAFARAVFLSRSQLHRKLTALTGLSLSEFVRNYRLDRAREILLHQNATVAEAAWQTGFQNTKYFSTCFKERFGVSPSEVKSNA